MNDVFSLDRVKVRGVEPADEMEVAELITAAFDQVTEARLVHELRHCGALVLERIAVAPDGRILGHVAYSRVTGTGEGHRLAISCLAPVSVLPDLQRKGIGSLLIEAGNEALKAKDEDLVLVLGPPAYYPRFGFDPVLARQVHGPYAGDAFMALALSDAGSRDLPVNVTFATPFQEFE